MKKSLLMSIITGFLLCSCGPGKDPYGSNGTFGLMNNDRVFGTVVSVNESEGVTTHNVGTALAGSGASVAGAAAGSAVSGSILSPLSGTLGSVGGMITGNSTPGADTTVSLHYVIEKDDGQLLKIDQAPEEGDTICYPGQRVMVQANGEYLRVYPSNVENPLSRHVPGANRGGS